MIVFVGGMPRSGSTYSFNIVREILLRRGGLHQEANIALYDVISRSSLARNIVMKGHSADDFTVKMIRSGAAVSICTIRRPEDSIAAWMRIFGFDLETSIEHMKQWIGMYHMIAQHSLIIRYEQVEVHPYICALRIMRYLTGETNLLESFHHAKKFDKNSVKRTYAELASTDADTQDLGFSYHNSNTFFHKGHVEKIASVRAADRISIEEIRKIRECLHEYIDDDGQVRTT